MIPPDVLQRAVERERADVGSLLRRDRTPLGPTRVALRAYAAFEDLAQGVSARARGPGPECKAGCAWCCRGIKVEVTPPEALAIAEWMLRSWEPDELEELKREIAKAAQESRRLDAHARHVEQTPCFFLEPETNTCSIYAIRPMRCRGHTSHDAAACERACKDPDSGLDIPVDLLIQQVSAIFTIGQQQAMHDTGCDAESYELISAVHAALSEPDASVRWHAGEDVFGSARLPSDAADRAAAAEHVLHSVVGTAANASCAVSKRLPRPGRSGRMGRNEPCPCGSGRKWKKCCGLPKGKS